MQTSKGYEPSTREVFGGDVTGMGYVRFEKRLMQRARIHGGEWVVFVFEHDLATSKKAWKASKKYAREYSAWQQAREKTRIKKYLKKAKKETSASSAKDGRKPKVETRASKKNKGTKEEGKEESDVESVDEDEEDSMSDDGSDTDGSDSESDTDGLPKPTKKKNVIRIEDFKRETLDKHLRAAVQLLEKQLGQKPRDLLCDVNGADPHAMLEILRGHYKGRTEAALGSLLRSLGEVRHDPTKPVEELHRKLDEIFGEMELQGYGRVDQEKKLVMLGKLHSSWDSAKLVWRQGTSDYTTFKGLTSTYDETRRLGSSRGPEVKFVMAQGWARKTACRQYARGGCRYGDTCKYAHVGSGDHKREDRPGPTGGHSSGKCLHCKKRGHRAKDCRQRCTWCDRNEDDHARKECPRSGVRTNAGSSAAGKVWPTGLSRAVETRLEVTSTKTGRQIRKKRRVSLVQLAMTPTLALDAGATTTSDHWKQKEAIFLDSGAAIHSTGSAQGGYNIKKVSPMRVETAGKDSPVCDTKMTLDVSTPGQDGVNNTLRLSDVLVNPNLGKLTLISESRLQRSGVTIVRRGSGNTSEMYMGGDVTVKGGKLMATAKLDKYGLYQLHTVEGGSPAMFAKLKTTVDYATLHKRMNHAPSREVMRLAKLSGLRVVNAKDPPVCATCQVGKSQRQAIRSKPWREPDRHTKPGERLAVDKMGKLQVASTEGYLHIVCCTDFASGAMFMQGIRYKNDQLPQLKMWMAFCETQTGNRLKELTIDGELFQYNELKEMERVKGFKLRVTEPYTSAQNPRAERTNGVVAQDGRTLRIGAGQPRSMSVYAAKAALYVRNRMIYKNGKSRYELFYGKKPALAHIVTYGCLAFRHIKSKQEQGKFGERAELGTMVGYATTGDLYLIMDNKTGKVHRTNNVRFDESRPGWNVTDLHDGKKPSAVTVDSDLGEVDDLERDLNYKRDMVGMESSGEDDDDTSEESDIEEEPAEYHGNVDTEEKKSGPTPTSSLESLPSPPPLLTATTTEVDDESVTEDWRNVMPVFASMEVTDKKELMRPEWRASAKRELDALTRNDTYEWVREDQLPPGLKVIPSRFVYAEKTSRAEGDPLRYKSRLVAQQYGPATSEHSTFTPTPDILIVRAMIANAAHRDWELRCLDFENAFLNSPMDPADTPVYVRPPKDFQRPGYVWLLKKGLYGLKRAGRMWRENIDGKMTTVLGWERCVKAQCLYVKKNAEGTIMAEALVHVDDFLHAGENGSWKILLASLRLYYKVKDEGPTREYIGIQVEQGPGFIFIHQINHANKILAKYVPGDTTFKSVSTPAALKPLVGAKPTSLSGQASFRAAIGDFLWLARVTRPDLSEAVSAAGAETANISSDDGALGWALVNRMLRFLAGTKEKGIKYYKGRKEPLYAYTDSNWAGDKKDSRSQSGFVFFLAGGPVSWLSKKQSTVAQSSAEAEVVAANACAREGMFLLQLFKAMQWGDIKPLCILEDNTACISISENGMGCRAIRHILVKEHYLSEKVEAGFLKLKYVRSAENVADIFTKPLSKVIFAKHAEKLVTYQ